MTKGLIDYFKNDELAVDVWKSKYQVKNNQGEEMESTPEDMHQRLARAFAKKEYENVQTDKEELIPKLSKFGQTFQYEVNWSSEEAIEDLFFSHFQGFRDIVPQGSIMSILGHPFKTGSLSNCFVIPAPLDSYGGILKSDEQLVQLMKRRGGVGTNLNLLRPTKTLVSNAAGTSTGAPSFAERYSNSTREVAQDGRRGALMLLLSCLHPDVFKWTKMKQDRTKVTGANISNMLTDKFMAAAKEDKMFVCRFPIDYKPTKDELLSLKDQAFNKLVEVRKGIYLMKIKAKELFDLIIEMAWESAEPGVAFIDRIINYSPDGVYFQFMPIASNPCGEQWLQAYDSCRLLALNLFSIVKNAFTTEAEINYDKLYEISYIQQRLADTLVDLEIEYVQNIIKKIVADPEPEDTKRVELELWQNVLKTAKAGRRTGCGFTALADMLAGVGVKYDSDAAKEIIEEVCKVKMRAELDCSIDLAILRGPFEGWNPSKEFVEHDQKMVEGLNSFYEMLRQEFPEQVRRMIFHGRRNVSWSTVAPTGTVSIMTQTTSGLEPLFLPYYMRRKKINANDPEIRVDFVDASGDKWQEFAVLHPKFKEWILTQNEWTIFDGVKEIRNPNDMNKEQLQHMFYRSPWYGSTANDINWTKRVEIQSIIQKYTTNAISSTINLPNDVSKEEVANIYWTAWKLGLKGVTVYRDGCRTGVLVSNEASSTTKEVAFSQKDATKRPKTLNADIHVTKVKGVNYSVIVSVLENHPYEVFVLPEVRVSFDKGTVVKEKKGLYNLYSEDKAQVYEDIGSFVKEDEAAIARLLSVSLRHGTDVRFIVDQLSKTEGNMVGFSKAICRCLKPYIPEGLSAKEACPECHQHTMIYEEGCKKCLNCGHSKC